MFRGFALSELRLLIALLAVIGGGWLVYQWRAGGMEAEGTVYGAAAHHPPGELVYTAGGGRGEQEPSRLAAGGRIDLNRATEEDLQLLPGIGPARSRDIVQHREEAGPFPNVEALEAVHGIGPRTLERLAPYLEVGELPTGMAASPESAAAQQQQAPRPVWVNRADARDLQRLHGVGEALSRRIVEDRTRRGPFRSPQDMQRVSGIGPTFVERNHHVLRFD